MTNPTSPLAASEILTEERLIAAFRASFDYSVYDPYTARHQHEQNHPDLQLTSEERDAIRHALSQSHREVARIAHELLDGYDDLYAHQRWEALDLFANVVRYPHLCGLSIEPTRQAREFVTTRAAQSRVLDRQ